MSNPYEEFKTAVYDYVIIGTGVTESTIAASLSHQGKTVCVVDPNPLYGVKSMYVRNRELEQTLSTLALKHSIEIPLTKIEFDRSIGIDLTPQLFYSNGDLLNTITESEIYKYLDFLAVDGVFMYLNNKIIRVPDSKNTLFTCTDLSLIEKRQLMKFLNDIYLDKDTPIEQTQMFKGLKEAGSLRKYLETIKLSKVCQDIIVYGICMFAANDETNAEIVVKKIMIYAKSLGKYGGSPFVYCQYGYGDVAQGFSRSSSVASGVFLCGHEVKEVKKNGELWEAYCSSPDNRFEKIEFTVKGKRLIKNRTFVKEEKGKSVDYMQVVREKVLPFGRRFYVAIPLRGKCVQCIVSSIENVTNVALSVENDTENLLEDAMKIVCGDNWKEEALLSFKYTFDLAQWEKVKEVDGMLVTSDATIGIGSDIDMSVSEAKSVCGEELFREDEIVAEVLDEVPQETKETPKVSKEEKESSVEEKKEINGNGEKEVKDTSNEVEAK
ncbi:RAB GDP-dissociation inhibitor, putative [Entamoeba invadens IP1]|uniref:RAB GDP-dissociation inhibitor, putative n=1 Tax=Entamoeba invadens IP1 TaxID=370355 RepID=UPI0002C3F9AF|nr:RAB GDP-dissociation inhibitor, putative [Entamoeba invadens IP1]ELP90811.1 RAB GDP-dissociation inhibitor, putative [Entamoeba invadens IP1]|eukprot:XP_004257582.1 RAB GDP-dissociation inhibitor, putative [Entamoeba invadens IP1]